MTSHRVFPADLHLHTRFCNHADGTMDDMVRSALDLGLTEMGFADHLPYPADFADPLPNCVIPREDFPTYVSEVKRLAETYDGRITVRLGAEVDHIEDRMDDQVAACGLHDFDYVIGSVHLIHDFVIDYSIESLKAKLPELGGIEGLWPRYWDAMEGMIRSGLPQIIGHFDILKKFLAPPDRTRHSERVVDLLKQMKDHGLVLEINTGGWDRAQDKRPYPTEWIVRCAGDIGLEIALGSDAHRPHEVARYFKPTIEWLCSLGFKRNATFQKREMILSRIDRNP
jgi:histidinol-phosphatase (PHP family)